MKKPAHPHLRLLEPKKQGQRRILSFDGGGIRGVLTLGMLEHLEQQLRTSLKAGPDFRLCNYFDFVGGTSTGAILAAGVSLGMSVSELISFYKDSGAAMFEKQSIIHRLHATYKDEPLRKKLQSVFGASTTLGSPDLKSLLLVVTRNVTTDSPWAVTNNPLAKYNALERDDCNLHLPLWQLVRASTAAPVYFPPEVVEIGKRTFVFVDGGVTPYNNPAFLMFRNATASPFNLNWDTGEDKLLLLSFGTGSRPALGPDADNANRNLFQIASNIATELMNGMAYDQDINCRTVGRCTFGEALDREVGNMISPGSNKAPKLFTYARYDAALDREGLDELGFKKLDPAKVSKLDSVAAIDDLLAIGREYGAKYVLPDQHFRKFLVN
jgi:uncharacterized protein